MLTSLRVSFFLLLGYSNGPEAIWKWKPNPSLPVVGAASWSLQNLAPYSNRKAKFGRKFWPEDLARTLVRKTGRCEPASNRFRTVSEAFRTTCWDAKHLFESFRTLPNPSELFFFGKNLW